MAVCLHRTRSLLALLVVMWLAMAGAKPTLLRDRPRETFGKAVDQYQETKESVTVRGIERGQYEDTVVEGGQYEGAEDTVGGMEGVQYEGAEDSNGERGDEMPLASLSLYKNGVTELSIEGGTEDVVFLSSLDESELASSPGPFNIVRVVDFFARKVQDEMVKSFYDNTACSRDCGKEGVIDFMLCLGCIALSHNMDTISVISPDR